MEVKLEDAFAPEGTGKAVEPITSMPTLTKSRPAVRVIDAITGRRRVWRGRSCRGAEGRPFSREATVADRGFAFLQADGPRVCDVLPEPR